MQRTCSIHSVCLSTLNFNLFLREPYSSGIGEVGAERDYYIRHFRPWSNYYNTLNVTGPHLVQTTHNATSDAVYMGNGEVTEEKEKVYVGGGHGDGPGPSRSVSSSGGASDSRSSRKRPIRMDEAEFEYV